MINPSNLYGYVFSQKDFEMMSEEIDKYPDIVITIDSAYFPYLIDDTELVKFHKVGAISKRTFIVYSGGKVFSTTGMRCGWIIGPEDKMK